MGEWKEYNIGDVCESISSSFNGIAEKVVLINTSDVLEGKVLNHSYSPNINLAGQFKKTFRRDDILYSEIRPQNKRFAYIDFDSKDYIASTKLMVLRCDKSIILPEFFYFVVSDFRFIKKIQLIAETRSGTFPQITFTELSNQSFYLPPIGEQKKIVKFLSSLDAKIETNRKINARLEELAQALFKSWFIDFEPFGGKMPEDWELISLCNIVDNISGYTYKGDELQPSKNAMITIKNFDRNGSFKPDGYKEIVISSKCKPEQYACLFDVLVAHTDLTQNADIIGNPILILSVSKYENLVYSMDLTKVVPKSSNLSKFILYHILKSHHFKGHALGYVNGTTVLHMNKKAIPEYSTYLPKDLTILTPLGDALASIYFEISNRLNEIDKLKIFRDTLLPKLMSGEIKPE